MVSQTKNTTAAKQIRCGFSHGILLAHAHIFGILPVRERELYIHIYSID